MTWPRNPRLALCLVYSLPPKLLIPWSAACQTAPLLRSRSPHPSRYYLPSHDRILCPGAVYISTKSQSHPPTLSYPITRFLPQLHPSFPVHPFWKSCCLQGVCASRDGRVVRRPTKRNPVHHVALASSQRRRSTAGSFLEEEVLVALR
ncbi:unnamed protein product [Ectocarpus sp. 12 AP-2014]